MPFTVVYIMPRLNNIQNNCNTLQFSEDFYTLLFFDAAAFAALNNLTQSVKY